MPILPPELLLPIVVDAAGDPDKLDYTTLRHLCLTSREFLPLARAILYRRVPVRIHDGMGLVRRHRPFRTTDEEQLDRERKYLAPLHRPRIERRLTAAPHLNCLVETIKFNYELEKTDALWKPPRILGRMMALCQNFQHLEITDASRKRRLSA